MCVCVCGQTMPSSLFFPSFLLLVDDGDQVIKLIDRHNTARRR